ncbi:GntR family transcriptional regulator [Cellulomonas sp.]|uniref:GntR family transcriptional regulator n=1 Tax=Cellulomonas sp. TaxID=40001 RepID=UPI002D747302|nr:GntR family transcriptional regulator [Cellulomonas sp.]HYQ75635.1 GntR family transcriptional regulator [Cellulomonas sp.]
MKSPGTATPTPPAAEAAYRHVKDALLSGRLPAGEMVSEGDVAAELGMSRTPVREAFLRLSTEGWLRLFPKRGALVVPVAPGEAEAVVDARLLLESHAVDVVVRSAADREALAAALRGLVARQRDAVAAGDLAAYAEHDAAFHQAVVAAGGNDLLTGFSVTLRERQRRMVALSVGASGERAPRFVEGHEGLVSAIEAGDSAAFRERLREHLHGAHLGDAARGSTSTDADQDGAVR